MTPRDEAHEGKHEGKNDPYQGHDYVRAGNQHRFPGYQNWLTP
jgi:hypothetical protein